MKLIDAIQIVQVSIDHAQHLGVHVSVAVVDSGGHLICFNRMDGAAPSTAEVAKAKAQCSVGFNRPTSAFSDRVTNGELGVLTLPGVVALAGGVPISVDRKTTGAVGVSGTTPALDEEIALAGANHKI